MKFSFDDVKKVLEAAHRAVPNIGSLIKDPDPVTIGLAILHLAEEEVLALTPTTHSTVARTVVERLKAKGL